MFARFDENPAMTLQDIKETKRYGRTHARTYEHTHGQREKQYTHHKQSLGGGIEMTYIQKFLVCALDLKVTSQGWDCDGLNT